jgi:hypothetical protein
VSNDDPMANGAGEAISALFREHKRIFLLLDPFAGEHLQLAVDALTSPPAHCMRIDDPIFKGAPQSAPLLVELLSAEQAHHDLLAQSITRAQEEAAHVAGLRSVCAWLFTDDSLKRLHLSLLQRLDARYPDGERIYLRYFDPRVMPRLADLLRLITDQPYSNLSQLFGSVLTWCHLNREGRLQRYDNPRQGNSGFGGYLRFDENTAASIDRIEMINLTARALLERSIPCKQSDDGMIDTHLVHAKNLGLQKSADMVAYTWRAIRYGPAFTRQPGLHELIMQSAVNGIPFDALIEDGSPSFALDIKNLSESTA